MRGELRYASRDPASSAPRYVQLLARRLEQERPRRLLVEGASLTVRGGMMRFVSNWNLLVPVSSATVRARADGNDVVVEYHVLMTEILLLCGVFSLVFAFEVLPQHSPTTLALALGMIWGWLFGGNYALMRFRMKRLFRRVVIDVHVAEARLPHGPA